MFFLQITFCRHQQRCLKNSKHRQRHTWGNALAAGGFIAAFLHALGFYGSCQIWTSWRTQSRVHTHSVHTYVRPLHPYTRLKEQNSASAAQRCCVCHDEYISGSLSGNGAVVATRSRALPYHFLLDEHGVWAELVEDLNITDERKSERWIEEEGGRVIVGKGEWKVTKQIRDMRGERRGSSPCVWSVLVKFKRSWSSWRTAC